LTRLQNLRTSTNIDKYEYRASRYGALDLFAVQTNQAGSIITPEMEAAAVSSIGQQLEVPVIDFDGGISIGNERLLVIADSENTSRMVAINFATYAFGFTMVPVLYKNNEVDLQRDFNTKMLKYSYLFANTLDAVAEAALNASSTTVISDPLNYNVVGDTVRCPWVQREQLLGDLNVLMAYNDYYDPIHIVANGGVESLIRSLTEKGLYNEINKQLQYSDKILHFSNRVLNNSYGDDDSEGEDVDANGERIFGTGYAVNAGSVGMLRRLEREALVLGKSRTGHEWGRATIPVSNIEVGTYYYESVGDFNTIAGAASADMDRVRKEHYGFAVDLAFLTRYNSRANVDPEPIIRFEVLAPATT